MPRNRVRIHTRTQENRRALTELVDEPFASVVEAAAGAGRHYRRVFSALRLAGALFPIDDVRIAATRVECGGHLATFDHGFNRAPGREHTALNPDG